MMAGGAVLALDLDVLALDDASDALDVLNSMPAQAGSHLPDADVFA